MRLDDILHQVQRPARYAGGEWNSIVKDTSSVRLRVLLAWPDLYEAAASDPRLGSLYAAINVHEGLSAERVFSPWLDLEEALRSSGAPLFSLETKRPLSEFDLWYIDLDSPLSYSNFLTLLDLAGLSVTAGERGTPRPLIVVGGRCAANPEPLAGIVDAAILGEPAGALLDICALLQRSRTHGDEQFNRTDPERRDALLRGIAAIEGVYVPTLYAASQPSDELRGSQRLAAGVPLTVHPRSAASLPPVAERPIVPYLATATDHTLVTIGVRAAAPCDRCGDVAANPPVASLPPIEMIVATIEAVIRNTGFTEVGLHFSNVADYTELAEVAGVLRTRFRDRVRFVLPPLSVRTGTDNLIAAFQHATRGGLTLTLDAASERLRLALGQSIRPQDVLGAVEAALRTGIEHVRLAYVIGMPDETDDDLAELIAVGQQAGRLGRQLGSQRSRITVEVSFFVPAPGSPCERAGFLTADVAERKIALLQEGLHGKHLKFSHRAYDASLLEAVLARGDRSLGPAVVRAWELGARFDARTELFNWDLWQQAFVEAGIHPEEYASRGREANVALPWSHLHGGTSPAAEARGETVICGACGLRHAGIASPARVPAVAGPA